MFYEKERLLKVGENLIKFQGLQFMCFNFLLFYGVLKKKKKKKKKKKNLNNSYKIGLHLAGAWYLSWLFRPRNFIRPFKFSLQITQILPPTPPFYIPTSTDGM